MKHNLVLVGTRLLLLVSAITVSAIVFKFTNRLNTRLYRVPWAFTFLQGTAILTLCELPLSLILRRLVKNRPLYGTILSIIIAALWTAAFILTTIRTHFALSRRCSKSLWTNKEGVVLCHLYKTLFSSALIACVSSLCALILDLQNLRPKYPRISYTRPQSRDIISGGRGCKDGSEPLFLQPFDADSTSHLVAEPYGGAGISDGTREEFVDADSKLRVGRTRARSLSPRLAARSNSPLLRLQLDAGASAAGRSDERRSRPSSMGPDTARASSKGYVPMSQVRTYA